MADILPQSGLPIRRTTDFLPTRFQTTANAKFFSGGFDALYQPGYLEKLVGYLGRKYGKIYNSIDTYLDDNESLRSKYQLEPSLVYKEDGIVREFYDYIDLKNILKFFNNENDRDDLLFDQDHYTWDPPIDWDKFVNFREYYWIPAGPPPIKVLGQNQEIVSTYKVKLGTGSTWIFSPDGLSNNPTITLYRGQTYKFAVEAPDNGFVIRTAYDTGSLSYDPNLPYVKGQIVVFDNKVWKAKTNIPVTEGSTINEQSQDWEYIEPVSGAKILDYNKGIENNGVINGVLVFNVPLDAPDLLYYQSLIESDRFGQILIADIESNTSIDIEKEIIGKKTYLSGNNIEFSNGMIIYFEGNVIPEKYANGKWLVEGVGDRISLIDFQELVPSLANAIDQDILFDNAGYDSEPFDDATFFPGSKDYLTINRASQDSNPWSRYNRWFHRDVIDFSHRINGTDFEGNNDSRAKRPIIEFKRDLRLFNHGIKAKKAVDFVDTFTTDVFSIIEGSQGYVIDGEEIFQGARILFTADTDRLANNRIYEVNFINHSSSTITKDDWSVFDSYRLGETVRYNGQSFRTEIDNPTIQMNIVLSNDSRNTLRIAKDIPIVEGMAIGFKGEPFGGISIEELYYILEIDDSNETYKEFTISSSRFGVRKNLNTGAPGEQALIGFATYHPTDNSAWSSRITNRQVSLRKIEDTDPILGECVLIRQGKSKKGLMYHFDGNVWKESQQKTTFNQAPLFEILDEDMVSFGDKDRYPSSSFIGSEIFSYKINQLSVDNELGFGLSYQNIDNIGDILFEVDLESQEVTFESASQVVSRKINTGFFIFNDTELLKNGWTKFERKFSQPIIYSKIIDNDTSSVILDVIDWDNTPRSKIYKIILYINGKIYNDEYSIESNVFLFPNLIKKGDVVSIKIYCDSLPKSGYYEVPLGLSNNPFNDDLSQCTLGEITDHIQTSVEIFEEFNGAFPGKNNLRDIDGFQPLMKRFLKHSGISGLSSFLLCNRDKNIIFALDYAKKSYTDFKSNFVSLMSKLEYPGNPVDFVDQIIQYLADSKNNENEPFIDTDMIGSGAFSKKTIKVEDTGIKIFALNNRFSLSESSRNAVYVYINGVQLFANIDYVFNTNFGFVEILKDLNENDEIEIREYTSTSFNYIPPTPTKLGLFKKYRPRKFIDDTYITPREVIEGHDGSINISFNDYRDDVLLELESRIYNNIKVNYSSEIFDIDAIIGSEKNNSIFKEADLNEILSKQFRKYIGSVVDYENTFYSDDNEFTWTYFPSFDRLTFKDLPGFWRGIYFQYYDTDRPHTCPWEMLGFSEKPSWWENTYGPAPYTSGNLILWEDVRDGIIRQGDRAGIYERYKRPNILEHLPVDEDGNLLSPNSSRLVGVLSSTIYNTNFKFGDRFPLETVWRRSSDYPFSIIMALCLLRPFEFIGECLDKNITEKNIIGQTVSKESKNFLRIADYKESNLGGYQSSGLINFLTSYYKFKNLSVQKMFEQFSNIDINLSSRLSGFVDKDQQRFVIDAKNPKNTSSSVFIPQENYEIFYNKTTIINKISYSGIIFEKLENGYKISGYDKDDLYFTYYPFSQSGKDVFLSVGGTDQPFTQWQPGINYKNGQVVSYNNSFFRVNRSHFSADTFDPSLFIILPKLPRVNGKEVYIRKVFNKQQKLRFDYGTILRDEQAIVDFICGYQEFLIDQGFTFTDYDQEVKAVRNWELSIKEFLLWTTQNWKPGTILTVSPSANNLVLDLSFGSVEDFYERFIDFQFVRHNGTIININQLDVWRDVGVTKVTTTDPTDGICYAAFTIITKEHVVVFNDRTVFNDVIYDKRTGYRQERIKFRGFRTVDWQGDLFTPGFILDNLQIDSWQQFKDYKLGDIVQYESNYYTSLENQYGASEFNFDLWKKVDQVLKPSLVPNYDFRINQFSDFYEVNQSGVGFSQRTLARHLTAYQPRSYLENLSEDDVSQFKIYQGFIREKGTINSVDKIFNKLSSSGSDSVDLFEEWAFRVGDYGGLDQRRYIEFVLDKTKFNSNPQLLNIVEGSISPIKVDQYYRINQTDFTIYDTPFSKDIFPKNKHSEFVRSAGYVNPFDVEKTIRSLEDLLSSDINDYTENDHIWITFDFNDWNVYRFNHASALAIREVEKEGDVVLLYFNRRHGFQVDDIIGIKGITNLDGFYSVVSVESYSVEITLPEDAPDPEFDGSSLSFSVYKILPSRLGKFLDLDVRQAALLKNGSKLWIDDNGEESWQVIQKNSQFTQLSVGSIPLLDLKNIGTTVAYAELLKQSLVGVPDPGYVLILSEATDKLTTKQWVSPRVNDVEDFRTFVKNSFGSAIAVSPDNKVMAVGAPLGSGFLSNYKGEFDPSKNYIAGSIVSSRGKLWSAVENYVADSASYLDDESGSWQSSKIIEAFDEGANYESGPFEQGAVFVYKENSGFWSYDTVILSPKMDTGEKFGSKIAISVSGNQYYMAVSAPGAVNNMGRVYLFTKQNNDWSTIEDSNYRGIFDKDGISVPARYIKNGRMYTIESYDETDYTNFGADSNTPGETFVATGVGESFSSSALIPGKRYEIVTKGATNFVDAGSPSNTEGTIFVATNSLSGNSLAPTISVSAMSALGPVISPNAMIVGTRYRINSIGTTDFTQYGAASNTVGTIFTCIRVGSAGETGKINAVVENRYRIVSVGTTDFTQYGAESNDIGTEFIFGAPNAILEGTGTVKNVGTVKYALTTGTVKYAFYPEGSIVWWTNRLWKATQDFYGDGSSVPSIATGWEPIDNVSSLTSLPTIPSYIDDGSTVSGGLLQDSTYTLDSLKSVELIKEGDQFGSSVSMNRDGSILVVGAPFADGVFYYNFKGVWSPLQEYLPGDVVRVIDPDTKVTSYRTLLGPADGGVEYSINDDPSGNPWTIAGDSSKIPSGKVFIYKRNIEGSYDLFETITADNINDINETGSIENIASGDNFGHAVDLDSSGVSLIVSSPNADIDFQSQGSVFYFRNLGQGFKLKQRLQSFEEYPNENFGSSISISSRGETIAVGATNARTRYSAVFDGNTTLFDGTVTTFFSSGGVAGQVYVYENKDNKFFMVEKLDYDVDDKERFGAALDCTKNTVLVGSPSYLVNNVSEGRARLFVRDENIESWTVISQEENLVDISKIKNIKLLDSENNVFITDLQIVDHYKLKILNQAEEAIDFKTVYDPAYYTYNEEETAEPDLAWFDNNVGKVWWNIGSAKFIYNEQGDESFRMAYANRQVEGSSIDVYEWVESSLLPSAWLEIADTEDGLSQGISGVPLFPDDTAYSKKDFYSPFTGEILETKYYFWVQNSVLIPKNSHRKISISNITSLIRDPKASGISFVTFIDSDKAVLNNVQDQLQAGKSLVNVEYNLVDIDKLTPIHREYQLLTEGVSDSNPSEILEKKWLDSLIGFDLAGNKVPDENLPDKQKYGLSIRPRQTIFKDRLYALKTSLEYVNRILKNRRLTDNVNFEKLNSFDPPPAEILNEYDFVVDTRIDLQNIGTSLVRSPILRPNIVDGRIISIDILDGGIGYRNSPSIQIDGDGEDASAEVTIDNEGSISSVNVIFQGKNYTTALVKIRNFSVLVSQDETFDNFWSIYSWDDRNDEYFRSKSQSFDTRRYWIYTDYYESGFSLATKINFEIKNIYEEAFIKTKAGDIIRVNEYGSGGWALLLRNNENDINVSEKFTLIGRQNGTIQFDIEKILPQTGIGLDTISAYDSIVYDNQPTAELRNIFEALKTDIFINDLAVEWNKLFFLAVNLSFNQLKEIDWAFKTSFVQAIHTVGSLNNRLTYKNDNLESYKEYLNEVKPYKTVIREYTSKYNKIENSNTAVSDFDSPPIFRSDLGVILPTYRQTDLYEIYPWKWFIENNTFSITSIEVYDQGEDYVQPPAVLIEGDGIGAQASAYISNGSVIGIRVIDGGKGYTYAPKISLVGGNGTSDKIAKAAAVIGNSSIRSINMTMKFDRISKEGLFFNFEDSERFIAPGANAVFELKYAPTYDKSKFSVKLNSQIVFGNEYDITFYYIIIDGYTLLKAKLILINPPLEGDIIEVSYQKNNDYLDAVNRIQKYYSPTDGMIGKELPQLMTGIDYGGIEIKGTTFEVTGGWDALPWFTDSWDSVESLADFYYVADGSTAQVELPEAPLLGQMISIYIKRIGISTPPNVDKLGPDTSPSYTFNKATTPPTPIRIDDPNFGTILSRNPDAVMPTFIGNGVNKIIDFFNDETGMPFIEINAGDTLIFRPFESDGAAIINDPNIIDTELSGGSLNAISQGIYQSPNTVDGAYITAAGITAEEIIVEGGKFISPEKASAPEENIPGQVLDSVSIKVFHTRPQGAAPLQNKVYIADGQQRFFSIGIDILEYNSLLVYVDKIKIEQADNYLIDFVSNTVEFITAPLKNQVVEIIALGIGGVNLLDYQEFIGDGETNLFLTSALFRQTRRVVVTVNGVEIISEPLNSSDFTDIPERTVVQLAIMPEFRDVIQIVCLGDDIDNDASLSPLIKVRDQQWRVRKYTNVDLHRQISDSTLLDGKTLANVDVLELDGSYKVVRINSGGEDYISLSSDNYFPDGIITEFSYQRVISSIESIRVYKNNILQIYENHYTIDLERDLVIFVSPPQAGDLIKINEVLLIYKEDIGSNVDIQVEVTSTESTESILNYIVECSIIDQQFGTLISGNFVDLQRASALSSIVIDLDGNALNGPDTTRLIYDGTNNVIEIGVDPLLDAGSITFNDLEVYINNVIQQSIIVYSFSSESKIISINPRYLNLGDEIKIISTISSDYAVQGNTVILSTILIDAITEGSILQLVSFSEYPSLDLISDQYTGGQRIYTLKRQPVDSSYVWVYKNGQRLTKDIEYSVDKSRSFVKLNVSSNATDTIKIIEFGNELWTFPNGYEIFKDMLNTYHYKRFSDKDVVLTRDLNYYDQEIFVSDVSVLFTPVISRNLPGVVYIGKERIEYFQKTENSIKQLRRGSLGTAIAEIHLKNSKIADVSNGESIPYQDNQERLDFVSDGSSLLIGPLGFVPNLPNESQALRANWRDNWFRGIDANTGESIIPDEYGPCDEIEVFVAGKRLRKDPISVFDEGLSSSSPSADKILEAEFSVDGANEYVRLTNVIQAGVRITVIRKIGKTWYDKGAISASAGKTLHKNDNEILRFILNKSTSIPE